MTPKHVALTGRRRPFGAAHERMRLLTLAANVTRRLLCALQRQLDDFERRTEFPNESNAAERKRNARTLRCLARALSAMARILDRLSRSALFADAPDSQENRRSPARRRRRNSPNVKQEEPVDDADRQRQELIDHFAKLFRNGKSSAVSGNPEQR
jgi:hypothetical protein